MTDQSGTADSTSIMRPEDLLSRLDRMIAGTSVMPFTTSMYLEVMRSCADFIRASLQPATPTAETARDALEQARAYIDHDVEMMAPGWRTAKAIIDLIDAVLPATGGDAVAGDVQAARASEPSTTEGLAKRYTNACFEQSSDGASWLAVYNNMFSLIQHLRNAAQGKLDRAHIAAALAEKWPGDYAFGDPPEGANEMALETADVMIAACSPPSTPQAPGHEDLMVTPESIDEWLKDNPLPEGGNSITRPHRETP